MSNSKYYTLFELLENDLIKDKIISYLFDRKENRLMYDIFNYHFDENNILLKNSNWIIYNSLKNTLNKTKKVNKLKFNETQNEKDYYKLYGLLSYKFYSISEEIFLDLKWSGNNYVIKLLETDVNIDKFIFSVLDNIEKILYIKDKIINWDPHGSCITIDYYECLTILTTYIDEKIYYVYIYIKLNHYSSDKSYDDNWSHDCYYKFIISDDLLKLLNYKFYTNNDCIEDDYTKSTNYNYELDNTIYKYYNSVNNDISVDDEYILFCDNVDLNFNIDYNIDSDYDDFYDDDTEFYIKNTSVFNVIYDSIKNTKT
jgi:hypothetical protein